MRTFLESIGYQDWISLSTRLRESVGSNAYDAGISLERVYLNATIGPLAAEVGRDVIVHHFHDHLTAQIRLSCKVNAAHAAFAQQLDRFVSA